jgi:hypothetical protein
MRHTDGKDMTDDDRNHGVVPNELGADDADIDATARRSEQVPADPEGVGGEGDDLLARDQQVGEIVCQMVGDGDRH